MAERKAVNKYYPPDWDPSKGSINKHVGQHPLRERAKKLSQGILVIRFEMPYNIWCGGCNSHIGMGVRYNAEKSKTGNYYSTPIYKFRMKCHLCPNYFEIETDPKNHDYVILNGARRKEQRWDPKENEQIVPEDKRTQKKLATDAMYKLEHGSDDTQRGRSGHMTLSNIEDRREEWKDDYILNKIVREKFRDEKKAIKEAASADQALLDKSSLDISLVEEQEHDRKMAALIKYSVTESFDEKQKLKRKAIENRPLFHTEGAKSAKTELLSVSSRSAEIQKKLGLNLLGGKKNPFDLSATKGSPSKVSVVIRKKSTEKMDKLNISPTNTDETNSVINQSSESVISNSDTNVSMLTDPEAGVSTESPVIPTSREESVVANGQSASDTSTGLRSPGQTINALGTLMSNYSDSDE